MLNARIASIPFSLRFLNFPQRKIQYLSGMIGKPLNLGIHSPDICEILVLECLLCCDSGLRIESKQIHD